MTERFCNYCDGVEGYIIHDRKDEVTFLVHEKMEADDITRFLNKQENIIQALQKTEPVNNVSVIEMKQALDDMIKFHEKFKSTRAINNIMWDCLTKLRRRWFKNDG